MRRAHWSAGLAGLALWTSPLSAQVLVSPGLSCGSTISISRGVTVVRRHHAFSVCLSGPLILGYGPAFDRTYPSISRLWVSYAPAIPVVVTPPPVVVVEQAEPEFVDPNFDVIRPRRIPRAQEDEGTGDDLFARMRALPRKEKAAAPEPERVPQPHVAAADPAAPAPAPKPPDKNAGQLALGKYAFAIKEYGRAERRFTQAIVDGPDYALAQFLDGQALFALGKYQEAVLAIQAGMRLRPNWPSAQFRPRELYGADAPDFTEQLQHLEEVLERNPRDPVVPFLFAYELWFDGRQEEARTIFSRAAAVTPDRTFIDAFLSARPGMPVAKR